MAQPNSIAEIDRIETEAIAQLNAITNDTQAEEFRLAILSQKGIMKALLKELGTLDPADRKSAGARVNSLRQSIEAKFDSAFWKVAATQAVNTLDLGMPAYPSPCGSLHPLRRVRDEMCEIFSRMGFDIAYGPEVETDWYNFEALNTPPHHPARDMQDTFYVSPNVVLRTHTSPVQIHVMQEQKPPIRCIMPGRVYRNEEISARSYCLFHQVEGLYVDTDVSFADLKGTLLAFCKTFFGSGAELKIRPSFFPFTEPSVEIDVRCFLCNGKGCSVCKQSGWLEILGAGMVHPAVLQNGGIDPETYTGFAFGMGVERIAMLKSGVNDIRLFYENDVRFLRQFA